LFKTLIDSFAIACCKSNLQRHFTKHSHLCNRIGVLLLFFPYHQFPT
jgi:hypothetical protein